MNCKLLPIEKLSKVTHPLLDLRNIFNRTSTPSEIKSDSLKENLEPLKITSISQNPSNNHQFMNWNEDSYEEYAFQKDYYGYFEYYNEIQETDIENNKEDATDNQISKPQFTLECSLTPNDTDFLPVTSLQQITSVSASFRASCAYLIVYFIYYLEDSREFRWSHQL